MSEVKISADQQTKNRFNMNESLITREQAERKVQQINEKPGFQAKLEGDTLVVKRVLRD